MTVGYDERYEARVDREYDLDVLLDGLDLSSESDQQVGVARVIAAEREAGCTCDPEVWLSGETLPDGISAIDLSIGHAVDCEQPAPEGAIIAGFIVELDGESSDEQ